MPFADTDGSTLKLVEETTFNVTPTNSVNWKGVRAKGWDLKPALGIIESEEISSNVDVIDAITATDMAQWSITGEYAKTAGLELFLEHVMRSTFATNVLKGGVVKKSLSIEGLTVGSANEFEKASGCRVDTFSLSGRVGQIVETTISGMGGAVAYGATSAVGTGTLTADGTNRVLALADLTTFAFAGDTTPLVVTELSLTIQNNTREQFGAGSVNLQGVGYGTRRVSGSMTAYFETREQLTKFKAGTKSDLSFVLTDGTNSHTWRIPALKFTEGGKPVSGRSSDIMQTFSFVGTYNVAQATALMITRTP